MTGESGNKTENKLALDSWPTDVLSALVQITPLLNSCIHVHKPVHTSISQYADFSSKELWLGYVLIQTDAWSGDLGKLVTGT